MKKDDLKKKSISYVTCVQNVLLENWINAETQERESDYYYVTNIYETVLVYRRLTLKNTLADEYLIDGKSMYTNIRSSDKVPFFLHKKF